MRDTTFVGIIVFPKMDELPEKLRRGGGHLRSKKLLPFLAIINGNFSHEFRREQQKIPNEGGGVKGRLEFFRKLIRFGGNSRPLIGKGKREAGPYSDPHVH